MNYSCYQDVSSLKDYQNELHKKTNSCRDLFDDCILRLNKLKEDLQEANIKAINKSWKDLELNNIVAKITRKKINFLRQLIDNSLWCWKNTWKDKYQVCYKRTSHKNKITLIFNKNWTTCHISHITPRQLPYISNNINFIKSIISMIPNNSLKNELFLQLKDNKNYEK